MLKSFSGTSGKAGERGLIPVIPNPSLQKKRTDYNLSAEGLWRALQYGEIFGGEVFHPTLRALFERITQRRGHIQTISLPCFRRRFFTDSSDSRGSAARVRAMKLS